MPFISRMLRAVRSLWGKTVKIQISVGGLTLQAELMDNETARAIFEALPIESDFNTWGNEIYFSIPVKRDLEKATREVEVGDLAYWPPGQALCIFYGPTPASTGDKPVPASEVTIVGKVLDDVTRLREVSDSRIRLEALRHQ